MLFRQIGYYDVYLKYFFQPGESYNYYRFYDNQDIDNYVVKSGRNNSTVNFSYLDNYFSIKSTNNYMYRKDFPQIFTTAFLICFIIVFMLNIVTSIVKRGGVLSGLL